MALNNILAILEIELKNNVIIKKGTSNQKHEAYRCIQLGCMYVWILG